MSEIFEIMGHDVNFQNSVYIGDAVYAHVDKVRRLWIFTTDGFKVLDKICLEDEVFQNLCKFYENRILKKEKMTE